MNFYEQADELYAYGHYEKAYKTFELALLNGEEDEVDCLNYMACCQIHLGNPSQAIELLTKALLISPTWERLLFNKGRAYLKLGNMSEAFAYFNRAAMKNPNCEDTYFYLGVYYEKVNEYKKAILFYQKSVDINFEQAETHLNLGRLYWHVNEMDKALSEFEIAYEMDNELVDALWNKGLILCQLKEFAKAINCFEIVFEHYPKDVENINELAFAYYQMGDNQNALKWYRKTLNLVPDDRNALGGLRLLDAKGP